MGFQAKARRRPLCERHAHALERGQLCAAAIACGNVCSERRPLGHIETAIVAIEIGHDRLIAIARVPTDVFSHNVSLRAESRWTRSSPAYVRRAGPFGPDTFPFGPGAVLSSSRRRTESP